MNSALTLHGLLPVLPEIVLGVGALALLMLGVYRDERSVVLVNAAAIVLLVVAGVIVVLLPEGKLVAFGGSFVDNFARFLKILALLGSAAAILMSIDYARAEHQQRFEYSVLIVLSTLGMLMLISAADLIALYLGLELMSLPLYVVAAGHRTSLRSTKWQAISCSAHFRRECCSMAPPWFTASPARSVSPVSRMRLPTRAPDWSSGWCFVRRLLLQGLGRAVPYVDAGRL